MPMIMHMIMPIYAYYYDHIMRMIMHMIMHIYAYDYDHIMRIILIILCIFMPNIMIMLCLLPCLLCI